MELDITSFWYSAGFRDYSASMAELGNDAGRITWGHACEDAAKNAALLATDEAREAFRRFVRSSGGWTDAETAQWSDSELVALLIQWISGDARECFPNARTAADIGPDEWADYPRRAEDGHCSGRLFRADDGRVYFYIGE